MTTLEDLDVLVGLVGQGRLEAVAIWSANDIARWGARLATHDHP
jgi:hypothetical protein